MMRKDQAEAITKKIGSADGPGLIEKLNSLGENFELTDTVISIPKVMVSNIPNLQSELNSLSKVGRSFEITEEGEKLIPGESEKNMLNYLLYPAVVKS